MTFESDEVTAVLRAQARAEFLATELTCAKFADALSTVQRVELRAAIGEMRRVLHGNEGAPAAISDPEREERIERGFLDRGSNVIELRGKRAFVSGRAPARRFPMPSAFAE